jgi:hypothetical protein
MRKWGQVQRHKAKPPGPISPAGVSGLAVLAKGCRYCSGDVVDSLGCPTGACLNFKVLSSRRPGVID